MADVKFLGNTDDVTTCDCCGRTGLKSTVALEFAEGDLRYYGVTCAAHALQMKPGAVESAARKADRAREAAAAEAARKAFDKAQAPWFQFLAAYGTGADVFTRIESLGGYTAARAKFNALPR